MATTATENNNDESQPSERSPLLGNNQNGIEVDPEAPETNTDDQNQSQQDGEVLADEPSTKMLIATMGATWIGVYFAALDTSIVATLTGPISSSFDSLSLLSWLATGYLIANAACQPLSGKLTDIFSRRNGLIFSNIFFAAGTLMCGLAPNASTIIAGRVIAGIGGGGLTCISTFVCSDLVPLRRRGLWQGYGNLVFGLGMGTGGIFGGLLADKLSWRWAFLIQLPFIVVSTIMIYFLIDIPVNPSTKPALKRVDFLGSILLVISLVSFLFCLNSGNLQTPSLIITCSILWILTLPLFIYLECSPSWIPEPVIPVRVVFKSRTVLAACLVNWFSTMSAFIALYYVPLYLQVRGLSATQAGLRIIPFAASMSVGSLGSGYIMRWSGRYYWLNLIIMLIFLLGTALLTTFDASTPTWATYIYLTPLGLGYGSMLTITLVAMISAVDHQHQAVITAASYAFRSTGSSIGITLAGSVFYGITDTLLVMHYGKSFPGATGAIQRVMENLDEINHLPAEWDKSYVVSCFVQGLVTAFEVGFIFAVLAVIAGLFMKEHVLHKNLARN